MSLVHQASHAVAAACFRVPVPFVDPASGSTNCSNIAMPARPEGPLDLPSEFALKAHGVVLLAGVAAERRLQGKQLDAMVEDHPDAVRARQIVEWMLVDNLPRVDGYVRGELTITTADFLENWQSSISAVVAAALTEGVLGADRIGVIVGPAIEGRRRLQAYHEAAHAVSLWLEGDDQIPLSVGLGNLPGESGQNSPVLRPFSPQFYVEPLATAARDRELALRELDRVVAGEEMARLIDASYPGAVLARSDRQEAERLARKLADGGRRELAQRIEADARATVRERLREARARALVDGLALALLLRSPLGQDEIREVFDAVEQDRRLLRD